MSESQSHQRVQSATAIITAVCAVVMVGFVGQRLLGGTRTPDPFPRVQDHGELAAGRLVDGPAGAAVTAVEFTDFQCPACRQLAPVLDSLRAKYPTDLRVEIRHLPLESHPQARAAAAAAECAAQQGRFRPMHDTLFARQRELAGAAWSQWAADAGVADTALFARCLTDPAIEATIAADAAAAAARGLRGTPMLYLNDIQVRGAFPFRIVDSLVQVALRERRGR